MTWRPASRSGFRECPRTLWELACQRRRPASQPDPASVPSPLVGAGLSIAAPQRRRPDCQPDFTDTPGTLVGAGLPAKAVVQLAKMLTIPPSSRASPLPQWLMAFTKVAFDASTCGSETGLPAKAADSQPDFLWVQVVVCRTDLKATSPCAIAYNYARIRRLVHPGP